MLLRLGETIKLKNTKIIIYYYKLTVFLSLTCQQYDHQ